jgi:hypothetical protein
MFVGKPVSEIGFGRIKFYNIGHRFLYNKTYCDFQLLMFAIRLAGKNVVAYLASSSSTKKCKALCQCSKAFLA